MSLELVIVFFLVLLLLKTTMFKGISTATVVGFTIILIFLIVVVKGQQAVEHFRGAGDLVYLQDLAMPATIRAAPPACTTDAPSVPPGIAKEAPQKESDVSLENTLTEDMDQLTKTIRLKSDALKFYYSVFSPISYKPSETTWQSVVASVGPIVFSDPPNKLTTEKHISTGMPLGTLSAKGPESSALGINGAAEYTIHIMMRFNDVKASTDTIEVFTLYSADPKSDSPVGISMLLQDIDSTTVVQSSKILIRLSNNKDGFLCVLGEQRNLPLDSNEVFVFSIAKTASKLSAYMSKLSDQSVEKVVDASINHCHKFVNLPMMLNANNNVNANVFVFAGHNVHLAQDQVSAVHSYLFSTFKRMNDNEYIQALSQIRDLEKKYKSATECPLDKEGCVACDAITDWSSLSQLMFAPQRCHERISEFCKSNKSEFCGCWNETSASYNLPTCKALRDVFAGKSLIDIDTLSEEELKRIKARYDVCNVRPPAQAPAASPDASCSPPPPADVVPPSPPTSLPPSPAPAFSPPPSLPMSNSWPNTSSSAMPPMPPMPLFQKAAPPQKKCKKKTVKDTSFLGWVKHMFSAEEDE